MKETPFTFTPEETAAAAESVQKAIVAGADHAIDFLEASGFRPSQAGSKEVIQAVAAEMYQHLATAIFLARTASGSKEETILALGVMTSTVIRSFEAVAVEKLRQQLAMAEAERQAMGSTPVGTV